MAAGRYEQRKTLEAAEANAIGTEYARSDLMPAADAPQFRVLLREYIDQRIISYKSGNKVERQEIDGRTRHLQVDLSITGRVWCAKIKTQRNLFTVLPFVMSLSFLLIADIDSPSFGIIRIQPENLSALALTLQLQ
jgi:hypothetical protein